MLKLVGMNPVVVHGGGPQIEQALAKMGKKGEFVQGMRVTDEETMEVVEMVLAGQVNQEIVGLINHAGGKAVGLTGQDGNLIRAKKLRCATARTRTRSTTSAWSARSSRSTRASSRRCRAIVHPGDLADRLRRQQRELQHQRRRGGRQAGRGAEGREADAADQHARRARQERQAADRADAREIDELFADGTISGGMLPKIASALDAAKGGVNSVHIIDGRVPHAMLLEILTEQAYGTMIRSH